MSQLHVYTIIQNGKIPNKGAVVLFLKKKDAVIYLKQFKEESQYDIMKVSIHEWGTMKEVKL